jgi:cysteinyl-tRNA synthetase
LIGKLGEIAGPQTGAVETETIDRFTHSMDQDLNVSAAWGGIFEWVREKNRMVAAGTMTPALAASALATWKRMDSVFALASVSGAAEEIPAEITALLEARQAAKKEKNFKRADEIRADLKAKGWLVEDTPNGPRLKRI